MWQLSWTSLRCRRCQIGGYQGASVTRREWEARGRLVFSEDRELWWSSRYARSSKKAWYLGTSYTHIPVASTPIVAYLLRCLPIRASVTSRPRVRLGSVEKPKVNRVVIAIEPDAAITRRRKIEGLDCVAQLILRRRGERTHKRDPSCGGNSLRSLLDVLTC